MFGRKPRAPGVRRSSWGACRQNAWRIGYWKWASNTNILAWLFLLSRLPIWGAMPRLLAEKLRYLRHKRKMTQVKLAEQLGLASHAHIANLEASRDVPSLEVVISIARLLSVPLDYLLRDTIPVENLSPSLIGPHDNQMMSFGTRLRALRLEHQFSQRDLARTLGLASRAYIGGLEADRGKLPSLELVVRMADLFSITTDDLLLGVIPASASSTGPEDA